MTAIADKRTAFRALHQSGCFALPNPWDIGTTRYSQAAGFKALATTSAGAAFALGLPDTDWVISRDTMLAHIRVIVAASKLPVNADFESGYADTPDDVARNVLLCRDTGVAGLSIEDATGVSGQPLYDLDLAVARIRAARAALDSVGGDVVLTGRAECFLVGVPDLDEVIRRLRAYAEAGADCLYAPGIRTREQILAVVQAVAPKPVNFLMSAAIGLTMADFEALGVRRVSVGSALARTAWGAFMRATKAIVEEGRFDAFADAVPFPEINNFFRDDLKRRG